MLILNFINSLNQSNFNKVKPNKIWLLFWISYFILLDLNMKLWNNNSDYYYTGYLLFVIILLYHISALPYLNHKKISSNNIILFRLYGSFHNLPFSPAKWTLTLSFKIILWTLQVNKIVIFAFFLTLPQLTNLPITYSKFSFPNPKI